MKEIFKSKGMLGFMLFMIGISYLSVVKINNVKKMTEGESHNQIVLNDK